MPSPFPGVDPYLEGPQWTSVHTALSVEIARQLAPLLFPRYVARTHERFVIATPDVSDAIAISAGGIYPDAFVVTGNPAAAAGGAGAIVMDPPALTVHTVMPEAIPHVTVEIRDADERRLVTAIEVLSPTNKRGDGRAEYLARRQKILLSTAHLIEVDLLRAGQRPPMRDLLPDAPYFVFVSRADRRPLTEVWPVALAQHLPTVPVPLLPGDADVALNLQSAFGSVYDAFHYELTLDYARPPAVPLAGVDAEWAVARVAEWRASIDSR